MTRVPYPEEARQPVSKPGSPFTTKGFAQSSEVAMSGESAGIRRKRLLSLPLLGQENYLVEKVRNSLHIGGLTGDRGSYAGGTDSQQQKRNDFNEAVEFDNED